MRATGKVLQMLTDVLKMGRKRKQTTIRLREAIYEAG